jgi:hypothetical protein
LAMTLVNVSSASHCASAKSTFGVKGISKYPVFLQFCLLPTSVISSDQKMVTYFSLEDLFTSVKRTLIVDTFCRHFIVPHHLLALASVTLHVFQQHIYYTLFVDSVTGSLQRVRYSTSSLSICHYQ